MILLVTVLVVGVIAATTLWWLRTRMLVVRVDGISMEPTLHGDDRLVVRRDRPDRMRTGQIVVLERPDGFEEYVWPQSRAPWRRRRWMVKRLVALPGEHPSERLLRYPAVPAGPVPPGYCLVLGDNPYASTDSRALGLIPLDRVLGVAVRRFGEDGALPG
jgi:signal peptidase I